MIARRSTVSTLLALGLLLLVSASPLAAARPERGALTTDGYIVLLRDDVSSPLDVTRALARLRGFTTDRQFRLLNGFAARLSPAQVAALRADPRVALVAPDRPVKAIGSYPIVAGDAAPTGVRRIDAATSDHARRASGVNVAVIDTGIDLGHPDLRAVDGVNCIGRGPAADDNGHGTHVAGTIGARNNGWGVVGVAPGTRLVAVKVLDGTGDGTFSSLICGIEWVTATLLDDDPTNDVRVANLSLGAGGTRVGACGTTSDPLHRAICASVAAGVIYVVAAGNSGWDFDYASSPDVPAAYPQVLTVTAMSDSDGLSGALGGAPACRSGEGDDRAAYYSNFATTSAGVAHTIAAPGTCIRSTFPGGGYALMSGTSMAAPHVAGAVALCLNEAGTNGPCAGLAPGQVVARMRSDARAWAQATPGYGYTGSPQRKLGSKFYGHLVRVGVEPSVDGEHAAPAVSHVTPPSGAREQPRNAHVRVSFSEPMDRPATEAAFSLVRAADGSQVGGTFSWSGNTMTFRPQVELAEGTTYRGLVAGTARNVAARELDDAHGWSFSTAGWRSPVGAVIESGQRRSGGYRRLAADDNAYYEINSTRRSTFTTAWYARFVDVPHDAVALGLAYSGRNTRSCMQGVSLWDWATSRWVVLDQRRVGRTKTALGAAATTGTQFVSRGGASGEVRVRVFCTTTAGSFYARADFLRLTFSR